MFTPDDKNGFSYFLNINTDPLAVVCPGVQFPSIDDSCYVDITDEVKKISESYDSNYIEEKYSYPKCGTQLVKRLIPLRRTRNR